ncbi:MULTISPECIES: energy-coupling factor ABC transporter ATP-binding protein [Lacticaseibacillus]|uniref:Cobalt ABC transporter ATP-binding component n=2 Tax=Lacticaseibacillus TaxID=2759736 RepID=A0AAD1ARI2_LACCA|nr:MULTISPECIES: energy-coupling factor ABC transporter ATP-binding protein [Lacticaseibacillus]MBI6597036.1 energy-coupling factor ABC transporter ATP-binding protein [Lacticaseibacillus casei]MBO1480703.1 energy-coupling factor ABC transporter ATP-binding protein [Lacticaseibacillus casei]MBO2416011.1 energy-coupling factor ABC transporter ATP-binding protein [Lacticaseibacillus casei]MCK2080464.1 energy-coupling factor ABC transporter ATP-binding protein [Lacticaseibacillus casei]MDG3061514
MGNVIRVQHLNYTYPEAKHQALTDVSFDVAKGEWLAIIGHNGSGKSTLAKNLNGLLAPESGTVEVAGMTLSEETVWDIRAKVGIVFQNPDNQFVGATVADDVAFGLENRGVPRDEMVKRVDESLKRVGMTAFADREPARLSGGQKQRVAIAGIIAQRPEIIILDESTSMLDPAGRQEVLGVIRELKDELNLTVLSITHDIDEAAVAHRIILLNDGKINEIGTPSDIFAHGTDLLRLGLDVPYSEKLKDALIQRGVAMPKAYLDNERLVDYLWTLHSTM